MFKRGDRIHLNDGTVHTMKRDGLPPRAASASAIPLCRAPTVRGFVRGALVDPDGTEHPRRLAREHRHRQRATNLSSATSPAWPARAAPSGGASATRSAQSRATSQTLNPDGFGIRDQFGLAANAAGSPCAPTSAPRRPSPGSGPCRSRGNIPRRRSPTTSS